MTITNRAFGQPRQGGGRGVRRRNAGLLPANQHPQANFNVFRPFRLFQRTGANVDGLRRARQRHEPPVNA